MSHRYPDPTFTVAENSVSLRLCPEEHGRLLYLETGEELTSDLWQETGGLIDLTPNSYVTLDNQGAHSFEHTGQHLHTLDPHGLDQDPEQTLALSTEQALIALTPDPDSPDQQLLTVDEWETVELTAQIPTDTTPSSDTRLTASYEFAAEPSPYLQAVPGDIALMVPDNGHIQGFTP